MSGCSKIRYANRQSAIAAMRAIARRYRNGDRTYPTGVYLCSPCRSWHLTSKSGIQVPPWAKARAGA
jgi:hypothetical protein